MAMAEPSNDMPAKTMPDDSPSGRGGLPLRRDGRGVTALEYGIVAAFLCLVLLGIFSRFGTVITAMFNTASSGI